MRHQFRFFEAPKGIPSRSLPDGPITGNGDLTLMWSGEPDKLRLYFTKVDFWKALPGNNGSGGLSPIGWIEVSLPLMADSTYDVTEDLDEAFLEGRFAAAHTKTSVRAEVCATKNIILLEVRASRPGNSVNAILRPVEGGGSETSSEQYGNLYIITRRFAGNDDEKLDYVTEGCAVLKEVSRHHTEREDVIRWALAVVTNHDNPSWQKQARMLAQSVDDECWEELEKAHACWWSDFWSKSSIRLPFDEKVENQWYADLYVMACCARNLRYAPGIWGGFSTGDNMLWHSDYHLNYNYQAPFYGLPITNHIELMDCYDKPLEDFMPYASLYAKKFLGCRGLYYPVGIGPMGLDTSLYDGTKEHGYLFNGQKSNGAFCATVIVMRWNVTRDIRYAREHGYPFLKQIASFWEDYLVWENGRYMDYNDGIHEVCYYAGPDYHPVEHDNVNPVISIGLIAMTFKCLLDMREALDVDGDRAEKWQHILDHLSKPVYYTREDGKEAIRATEEGMEYTDISLQYVYPALQVGSRSDRRLIDAFRNILDVTDNWESENRFCTFYPAAVRLGIAPDRMFEGFHRMIDHRGIGNGLFRCKGGGIENNAAIPSTLGDMLLQSFEGVVRLFPCWNAENDVSFRNFRADGAFLVSAKLEKGVLHAEIIGEVGGVLILETPSFGKYAVVHNDIKIPMCGQDLCIELAAGEKLMIEPM